MTLVKSDFCPSSGLVGGMSLSFSRLTMHLSQIGQLQQAQCPRPRRRPSVSNPHASAPRLVQGCKACIV